MSLLNQEITEKRIYTPDVLTPPNRNSIPSVPTKPARYRGDGFVDEEVMTEFQAPVAGLKQNVSSK